MKMDKVKDVSRLTVRPGIRSQQSKEWIILSLLQLMESTPYSHISITEIARKAGLARQTFYRNYQDKDDILFDYLCSQYEEFWSELDDPEVFSEEMFVSLFRMWKDQSPDSLIENIWNKDRKIRQIIFRSLEHYTQHVFQKDASEAKKQHEGELHYYARRLLSSTLHVLLIEWTLDRFAPSPEEMARHTLQLTRSMREVLL